MTAKQTRPENDEGAQSGAFVGTQESRELHPLADLVLGVFSLVLGLAPLLLGLALLLAHLVVGELAFLLLQLAFDFVGFASHLDPLRWVRPISPADRLPKREQAADGGHVPVRAPPRSCGR